MSCCACGDCLFFAHFCVHCSPGASKVRSALVGSLWGLKVAALHSTRLEIRSSPKNASTIASLRVNPSRPLS